MGGNKEGDHKEPKIGEIWRSKGKFQVGGREGVSIKDIKRLGRKIWELKGTEKRNQGEAQGK